MDLTFRAIERRDLSHLRDWRNDDRLRHGFREYRVLNMMNQRTWFKHITTSKDVEMFAIELDDVLIGVCGLCNIHWLNRTAEVSRYISPEHDSAERALEVLQFLIRKAFAEFNLNRLWGEAYRFSVSKIDALEAAGFVYEGTLRDHVYKLGKYHDSLIYGLLKSDVENY